MNNPETYIGEKPPTASQLFRLAAQSMAAAQATNTNRAMKTRPRTHFSVQEVHYYNDASSIAFDDYPAQIRRRMAIRIGRRTLNSMPIKEWSLKLFDTSWYERPGGNWAGVRNRYSFEWNHQEVTLAERHALIVPSVPETDLYDHLNRLSITDDLADILHAEMEMSQVTSEDCEQLISEAADYYNQSDMFLYRRAA